MALHFDVSAVKDYQTVTTSPGTRDKPEGEQKWHPVTESLVTLSMVCGFGEITEKNAATVAKRIAQYQNVTGPALRSSVLDEIYITEADVRSHIGFACNVAWMSDAKWHKKLIDIMERDLRSILDGRRNVRKGPVDIISERESMTAYEACELLDQRERAGAAS